MKRMKYGSQQKMKAPTITPNWVAAWPIIIIIIIIVIISILTGWQPDQSKILTWQIKRLVKKRER